MEDWTVTIDDERDRAFVRWVVERRLKRMDSKRPGRDTVASYRAGHDRASSILEGAVGEAGMAILTGLPWDVRDNGYAADSSDVARMQIKTNSLARRVGKRGVGDLLVPKLSFEDRREPVVLVSQFGEWSIEPLGFRFEWELEADRASRAPSWWTPEGSRRFRERRLRAACWVVPISDLRPVRELVAYLAGIGLPLERRRLRDVARWK